jgi:hypothetical protein
LREQGIIDREQGIRPRTNFLNHTASQNDVMNRLPGTRDYDMDCFAKVARLTQRPGDAVGEALAVENEAVPWLRPDVMIVWSPVVGPDSIMRT